MKSLVFTNLEWKHLFDVFTDPMFLLDDKNNILECNSGAVDLYGYTKDEITRMNLFDLRAPYTRTKIEHSMFDVPENVISFETNHVKKNGKEFNVEASTKTFIVERELFH